MKTNDLPQTNPLRYAVGMFGTSIPVNMFKSFAFIYYVDKLGLLTEQYAFAIFLYTFLDAIDNPVYGFLSDRTRTRWGRRRPWLVAGAPLLILCFTIFFNPPSYSSGQALFIHFLLFYMLTGTLDSLINANYGALFPELFQGDQIRAKTNALRQAFQLIAMMISVALTPMVTGALGYARTSLVYGILALGVILFCALGCRETPREELREKPPLLGSLKVIFSNPKFWLLGFTNAFYSAALSLVMSAVPFYVKYTLRLGNSASTILLASVLVVAVAGVAVWALLIRRFTLMPSWRAALLFLTLAFIPLYFVRNLPGALAACCLIGFGVSGALASMDLVGARIMDEDTRTSGIRREGIWASVGGFLNRLNGFFISFAYLLVRTIYGYENGDAPGADPGAAARFLMVVFPFGAMLLSSLVSRFLRFPELDKAESGA